MKTKGIALTGGIATGKSTAAAMLGELGFHVIDADQLARVVVLPGSSTLASVVSQFGSEILKTDGSLDRDKLRQLIFSDANAKVRLEALIHPAIRVELFRQLEPLYASNNKDYWFYEAALVFETGIDSDFAAVWVADCPQEIQLQRLMQRNQMNEQRALSMIHGQMPQAMKRQKADVIINTAVPMQELRQNLRRITATL